MWVPCFVISVALWLLLLAVAVCLSLKKYKRNRLATPTNALIIGTFVSLTLIFIPIHFRLYAGEPRFACALKTIFVSLQSAIRVFFINSEFDEIQTALAGVNDTIRFFFSSFTALLYVIAPILTFGFILSFFRNISSYRRYSLAFFKNVTVFTELNEKSLSLAKSLSNEKDSVIVFTDVHENDNTADSELAEAAKEIGAILFQKDALSIKFRIHSKKKTISFFAINRDEVINLKQASEIIAAYKDRDCTTLYVFSSGVAGELMMTSADKGRLKVRTVNDIRSLVYRTLYDNGNVLFDNAIDSPEKEKVIGAVVVGLGGHGTEMLKALSWYCQMDGYRVSIDAFEKDKAAASKFTAMCPELMDAKYNGVYVAGEAQYLINIHSDIDADTIEFANEIKKLKSTTYVFVSLGSDEANVRCAVNLRTMFEQMGITPVIHSVVYNSDVAKELNCAKNYKGITYDITFVGDLEHLYSKEVIINSELEAVALNRVHKEQYGGEEKDFWDYEYNYRSSLASALHMKARVLMGITETEKIDRELTDTERAVIEPLEHRRWNAYMRSEGYINDAGRGRNDLGKMHNDLVVFSALDENEKRKDSRVSPL